MRKPPEPASTHVVNPLQRWLARIRDLCLFRSGPQDLPYAPRALIALLLASALIEIVFDLRNGSSVAVVVGANIGTLAALGILFALLRWRCKSERFMQTALALVITGLLFEIVLLPLALLVGLPIAANAVLSSRQVLILFAVFVLVVWQAGISSSILRHSLGVPLAGGVLALLLIGFIDLFASALTATLLGAH